MNFVKWTTNKVKIYILKSDQKRLYFQMETL